MLDRCSLVRKFLPLLGVLAGVTILGACDLADDDGGPPGGIVYVRALEMGGEVYGDAVAFFIADLDTSNGSQISTFDQQFIPDLDLDECEIVDFDDDELDPIPVGLDVGSDVRLETGTLSETIVLQGYAGESYGRYYANQDAVVAVSKSYSVTLEGTSAVPGQTWPGAVSVPDLLTLHNAVGLTLDAENGTDLTWDRVGADAVLVSFSGNEADGWCLAADDGAFKIPAEFAEDLGLYGEFAILAINESTRTLNRRTVNVAGITGQAGDFEIEGGPMPTPTPGPGTVTNCQIIWATSGTTTDKYHLYFADLHVGEWTTGTKTYDNSTIAGVFLYDYDFATGAFADRGIAAFGQFLLEVTGSDIDDYVSFDDATSQTYTSDDGVVISGGNGSFTGTISDLEAPTFGNGTISITYAGSPISVGESGSFARCYDAYSFGPGM